MEWLLVGESYKNVFATSFAKGKGFRTSPLCFLQGDDPSSEDDEEVDRILSKSQRQLSVVSRKRSAHEDLQEEGDSPSENRHETHADKHVNVIGKLFVTFAIITSIKIQMLLYWRNLYLRTLSCIS